MITFLNYELIPTIASEFNMKPHLCKVTTLATLAILFSGLSHAQSFDDIGENYANLAYASYQDSLISAQRLANDIGVFLDSPDEQTLSNARQSWIGARKIYGATEVFRFSHPVVDDWEPQVNAWPLDEGFIDYVDDSNYFYELGNSVGKANLIANNSINIGSENIELNVFTPELLASLNEAGGTEANVATGWHAIEFLLWGQDLNGTNQGAGNRPYTDFASNELCTNSHCVRRRNYLEAVTQLLVSDLEFIVSQWATDGNNYRAEFDAMSGDEKLRRILYGVGSLSLGELAGERMKVALYANSPEDEHDCFSDTTHNTLYANAFGLAMVLRGEYETLAGERIDGASLIDWARANSDTHDSLTESTSFMLDALNTIVESGETDQTFDQLIAPGNTKGRQKIDQAIESLVNFTRNVELLAADLKLGTLNPDNAGHNF